MKSSNPNAVINTIGTWSSVEYAGRVSEPNIGRMLAKDMHHG